MDIYLKFNNKGNKNHNNDETNNNNYKNYIIAEFEIKEDDLNKDIKIINSYEQCKREFNWKNSENDFKYENEKEIMEKCKIKISNKIIPFNYFYKFEKAGIYKIEYLFSSNITKAYRMFSDINSLINIDLSNFKADNLVTMTGMFGWCKSLRNVNLSNFNSKNVIDMDRLKKWIECSMDVNL